MASNFNGGTETSLSESFRVQLEQLMHDRVYAAIAVTAALVALGFFQWADQLSPKLQVLPWVLGGASALWLMSRFWFWSLAFFGGFLASCGIAIAYVFEGAFLASGLAVLGALVCIGVLAGIASKH